MITISTYTGNWQAAMNPTCPRIGSLVRVAEGVDGQEWHDFKRILAREGVDLRFERYMPKVEMAVYRVVRASTRKR